MNKKEIKIRERRNGALVTIGTVNVDAISVASFALSDPLHAQWLQAAIDSAQTAQVLAAVIRQPDGSVLTLDCPITLDQLVQPTESRTGEYPRQKKALSEVTEILHLHVRNQKPDEEDDDPGIKNDESRWAAYNLSPQDRLIVIGQLKDRCRQIFLLDADGFKDIEIAEQLGIATKYVKNKRWKCNKQIENFIKHLLDQKK